MKFAFVIALSLVASSAALADGLICTGETFNVKLYNQVNPAKGTKNPAHLVVSERGIGTVAVLRGLDIEKTSNKRYVAYSGVTNAKRDGRYTSVSLMVKKQAIQEGQFAGKHAAHLVVTANKIDSVDKLVCQRYLKHPKSE